MFDPFRDMSAEEKLKAIEGAFCRVAATDDGKIVFATILDDAFLFREAKTAESQALTNFAKHLLTRFGEEARYRALEAILGG
jgi:hypothetical protein